MEPELQPIAEQIDGFWMQLMQQANNLWLPSRQLQLAVLVGCILVAYLLVKWVRPKYRGWMRTLAGRPKWQLRALLLIERRLGLILFAALVWGGAFAIAQFTPFTSRRYILELIGTISIAIIAVGFLVRLVHNPLIQGVVKWGLWIYVTLYYLRLTDTVSNFLDSLSIEFGDFRLSALIIINALVVMGLLFTAARLVTQGTSSRIKSNKDISPSMQVLAVKCLQVFLYGSAFFLGLKAVGFDLTGLAVLSGAIGLGLGFGLQKVVSNLVSGVIILLDKSIKPGDVISLDETFGWINALGARYVSVVTRDGKEYLIPNEDLITGQVVNWSHSNEFVRLDIFFGTAYDDDPHEVRRIAIAAAAAVNRVLPDRPPVCHIVGFGDSSVDYILRFWITDPTGGLTNIRGNVYLALWDAFQENGISIPFPQREVRMLGKVALNDEKAIPID